MALLAYRPFCALSAVGQMCYPPLSRRDVQGKANQPVFRDSELLGVKMPKMSGLVRVMNS